MPEGCPFCFSTAVTETLHAKEMYKGTRDVFDYTVCCDCASVYINDFPSDIARYYEGYYSFNETPPNGARRSIAIPYSIFIVRSGLGFLLRPLYRCPLPCQMKLLNPNAQAFLFLAAKADSRILDVGSGGGEFVRFIRSLGYRQAMGIDPFLDERSVQDHIRREDIHSVSGTYDVILLNHSLEHMTDPEAALRRSTELLASGGSVLIQIPNVHSPDLARFKQHWAWIHAPYHFAIPSRKGLEIMASRCGLKVVDAVCTSRPDHYLYSDEYSRDIGDHDPNSVRRQVENGSLDKQRFLSLSRLAYKRNRELSGDWIAYYLEKVQS